MLFSLRRKAPKDSPRLPSRTPILLRGSIHPRLERCCSARGACTGHHSPCREQLRLGSSRPQAQGARRVSASRRDACERGGDPRITRASRAWMPSFIAAIEPLPAAQTIERYVRGFFSFFSFRKEKNTLLLFKGENMYFSPQGEKIPKELLRLPPQTPIVLLGSAYPRLPTDGTAHLRALSVIRRAGSNCRWEACARRRKARAV